ncbi:MAG TPA: thermonuclease family protein [Beijerinckiaceae bacterium]|nr:thermonuclease family protein [Beijerinckiaceae bacterium]
MRTSSLFALVLLLALCGSALSRRPAAETAMVAASRGVNAPVAPGSLPATRPDRSRPLLQGPLAAELLSVIDGDTIEVLVQTFIDQTTRVRVRLRGIDAPELSTACAEEHDLAQAARNALAGLLAGGRLILTEIGRDKYAGRVVARVLSVNGEDVGARLLAEGYALAYAGGRRQPWCDTSLTALR